VSAVSNVMIAGCCCGMRQGETSDLESCSTTPSPGLLLLFRGARRSWTRTAVAVPFQHNCHHSVTSVGCRPARDWHSLPAPRPTWPLVLLVTASQPSWPATFIASHCRSAALADFQSTQKSSHLLPICQTRALTRIVSVDNCRRIVH